MSDWKFGRGFRISSDLSMVSDFNELRSYERAVEEETPNLDGSS